MKKLLPNFGKTVIKTVFSGLFALMLASCSLSKENSVDDKGYLAKFSDFTKIKAGSSTKADVIKELGSPSTTSMYGDETWFYIGKEQSKETFFEPTIKKYDAYAIVFNKAGVVSSVTKKGKDSLKDVEIADDYTKTSGNEITVLQQLFGNLGKFNPAEKVGGVATGVTPGSSRPGGY